MMVIEGEGKQKMFYLRLLNFKISDSNSSHEFYFSFVTNSQREKMYYMILQYMKS